jgi:hypothetical protein
LEDAVDNLPFGHAPTVKPLSGITRPRFFGLVAAALGAALGLGRVNDAAAARCRKKSARCSRKEQCCSNRCKRGFCYPRRR